MLYVITEDRNSGREFWKKVMETFLTSEEYSIVPFPKDKVGGDKTGNFSLNEQVDIVLTYAKAGDSIFIAFDNIEVSTKINKNIGKKMSFDAGDFLLITQQKCKLHQIDLYTTSYVCFEEVYLSYTELENLVRTDFYNNRIDKEKIADIIRYIRECINAGIDYYDRNHFYIQEVIYLKKDADKNKEHFADALLYQATHGIKHGLFSISKERNKSLKCWILDCESMQEHSNNKSSNFPSEYMCKNCKFCKKNCNSMEKLLDLDDKSLIKNEQLSIHKLKSKFIVKI